VLGKAQGRGQYEHRDQELQQKGQQETQAPIGLSILAHSVLIHLITFSILWLQGHGSIGPQPLFAC
jgi:hypothetical protein